MMAQAAACRIAGFRHALPVLRPSAAIRCAAALATALLLAPGVARAQCAPVAPVACENCFAVFVMPDTQNYARLDYQPAGANHLDLVTRYICQHQAAWTEPTTGKTMPILMVIQLGDLVDRANYSEETLGAYAEWKRVSAAFDNLDECTPAVPYLVTNGNHDQQAHHYERQAVGYQTYFGPDRWVDRGVACDAIDDCDWNAGQYFLGVGDTIQPFSRNNDYSDGGSPGPGVAQLGRHRAGLIRAPNGQRFLFLGLELAFDFPPPFPGFEGVEQDGSAWPRQLLSLYDDVPTVVFHHTMLWTFEAPDDRVRWGPELWRSDSLTIPPQDEEDPDYGTEAGMRDLYELLIEPYPQVKFLFTGHVVVPTHQADYTISRMGGPVWAFLRNYQGIDIGLPGNADRYGVGWNVVAVFDPDAHQVRVRSYRIDDVENYTVPPTNYDHLGTPAPTECFDTDQNGVGERIVAWDFRIPPKTPGLSGAGMVGLGAGVLLAALWVVRRRAGRS